ncbi:P-loop ATPase, Sll1717 family [Agromyces bauzanensis]|uniref:Uncharacterized protein n=1 Tax=Agromyces bauzanensis TaxID=1308924 RepID=A0A917PFP8_9MICO|nr:hypothetical protein [Agromyces bauzanensis]GGJ75151.1 hypothetical protein GCM10011372_11530 [Agromyces bauzanensis]
MVSGGPVEAIWTLIADTVGEFEDRRILPTGAIVKSRAQVTLGHKIVEADFGYSTFRRLVTAGAEAGYLRVVSVHKNSDIVLGTVNTEFRVLSEVVQHFASRGAVAKGAYVKPMLSDALGVYFDQSALGYRTFKEFCMAAQRAGYVSVLDKPEMPDFTLSVANQGGAAELASKSQIPSATQDQRRLDGANEAGLAVKAIPLDEAFAALRRIVTERHENGTATNASRAKQLLIQWDATFSEGALRYQRFGEFLRDAEQAGYVVLKERPGHGRSVVDLFPPEPQGVSFADIQFGYASAGAESARAPQLLLEGFYDNRDVARSLVEGSEYVVLGHKGSGKSAIGEHLVRRADLDPNLFVDLIDLKDFPYGTLSQLASDDSSLQLLRLSWRWLLLLRVFQSMLTDVGADPQDAAECERLKRLLVKESLIPSKNLTELSLRSVNVALKGGLPSVYGASVDAEFSTRQVQLTDAAGRVEQIASTFSTESRHIQIIDGLDELLSPDDRTYASLSALLGEVESLNEAFYRAKSAIKIVLLCRADLYERLSSPNKNKIRQNFAVTLRWSAISDEPDEASLEALILHRARLSGYVGDDPIRDLLPHKASVGKHQTDMWPYLVEHTRRTPRDLIALLTKVQRKVGRSAVTTSLIQKALNEYSTDYFVPELKDELQGYLKPDHVDGVFGLFSALRKRSFTLHSLSNFAQTRGSDLPVLEAVQILFECSAIGHDRSAETRDHEFRYLNSNLSVNPDLPLIVHRGAWWALSLNSD